MAAPEILLIIGAGLLAGAVNAIAGGGSLVSFPALLAVGYPAVVANVTNGLSMWPGYASSTAGFRSELSGQRPRIIALGASASAGGVVGVILLLGLPSDVFDAVVPWCVLLASALLAVQPRLSAWIQRHDDEHLPPPAHRSLPLHLAMFAAGAYGAYFGGGLGVVLLGVLGIYLTEHLHVLIGLKNALSLLVASVAVCGFIGFAPVSWGAFVVLAPAAAVGGIAGARLAKVIPPAVLRWTIVALGAVVGIVMMVRS